MARHWVQLYAVKSKTIANKDASKFRTRGHIIRVIKMKHKRYGLYLKDF